ncbi:hypothetical protein ABEB36_011328 [Hypothenemus hampei]|uniref:Uncharacterized protein n=1 Tax=Hypothenemus hampei TaxID=57062 RepID=A0ABD1EF11_HYPHA
MRSFPRNVSIVSSQFDVDHRAPIFLSRGGTYLDQFEISPQMLGSTRKSSSLKESISWKHFSNNSVLCWFGIFTVLIIIGLLIIILFLIWNYHRLYNEHLTTTIQELQKVNVMLMELVIFACTGAVLDGNITKFD